jgi:hypothetical protein
MTRISPLRGRKSFQRKPGTRPPRSITLVVCEGETERAYFEAARLHHGLRPAEVFVAGNTHGSAPISVVECAEQKANEAGGYDYIFCVFDRDSHESFARAREKIKALAGRKKKPLPIQEIVSIPCFEVWVLLHFERSDAAYADCAAVIERIRDQHLPDYAKAESRTANQLMPRIDAAVSSATWLEHRAEINGWNPYTSAHRLMLHLKQVAGEAATPEQDF